SPVARPSPRPAQHHHPRDRSGMSTATVTWRQRVDALDWPTIIEQLDSVGRSAAGLVLDGADCSALTDVYDDDQRFRSTIDMARHRFGEGEYRYFARP